MTIKYEIVQTFKITTEMSNSIDNLLDNLPRSECKGRCDLLRELLEIGLKSKWKKVGKKNAEAVNEST